MINRILKNNLLNRGYFAIFLSSIFFAVFAILLLISQRNDIIDNSISANARNINVELQWNKGDPYICVLDDGQYETRN